MGIKVMEIEKQKLNKYLKELIDFGNECNAICYDEYAQPGQFSTRLITVAMRYTKEELQCIIHDETGDLVDYFKNISLLKFPFDKTKFVIFVFSSQVIFGVY